MLKKVFLLLTAGLFFLPTLSFAEGSAAKAAKTPDLISQAGDLARKGRWDQSEIIFLKAAQSSIPDHRIQAYEGLTKLYKRLCLEKKAKHAMKLLEEDRKLIEKLVPSEASYYKSYTLQNGDSYSKIAAKEKISLEWLKRANHNQALITGKTIQVPMLPYNLVVNKNHKTLEWRRRGEVLKVYPVAVGKKETQTPGGEFTVVSKVKNPIWYRLKVKIPPESPENLLGTRWLGLNEKGYGIHGTRHPGNVGRAVSHGCVRMRNRDVEELFEWIPVGTRVSIQESR